jgi:hypothetical protein
VGSGLRAAGMAQAFTAIANDGSAQYYNPAGLAFSPFREFQISLAGIRSKTITNSSNSEYSGETYVVHSRIRPGSITLLRSFPTTQGGFAISAGFQSPWIFDDNRRWETTTMRGADVVQAFNDYYSYGQINLWTGAFGVQVAPNFGIGLALSLATGESFERFTYQQRTNGFIYDVQNDDFIDYVERTLFGYDCRLGLMYTGIPSTNVGMRIVLPARFGFTEYDREELPSSGLAAEVSSVTGRLETSGECALGISHMFSFMTLSVDGMARFPNPSAAINSEQSFWKAGFAIGAEAPLFVKTLLLRTGYGYSEYDRYPFLVTYKNPIAQEFDPTPYEQGPEQLASAGLAFLLGNVSFEAAWFYKFWTFSPISSVTDHAGIHRIIAGMTVRY